MGDDHPLRKEELIKYAKFCGGPQNVPRGESLEMVAKNRVRPFLDQIMTPILDKAKETKKSLNPDKLATTAGLVVAHANSLRALVGVLCEVEDDPIALEILEALRIPTGVPLVIHYQRLRNGRYRALPLPEVEECLIHEMDGELVQPREPPPNLGHPNLPVWPLDNCIPLESLLVSNEVVEELFSDRNR